MFSLDFGFSYKKSSYPSTIKVFINKLSLIYSSYQIFIHYESIHQFRHPLCIHQSNSSYQCIGGYIQVIRYFSTEASSSVNQLFIIHPFIYPSICLSMYTFCTLTETNWMNYEKFNLGSFCSCTGLNGPQINVQNNHIRSRQKKSWVFSK